MDQLEINFANCMTDRVGDDGISTAERGDAAALMSDITASLETTRGTGWERWRQLPFDPMRSAHVESINTLANAIRPNARNLVVLGIGGSALGNIALQSALNPHTWNLLPQEQRGGPRLFVLDNVEPLLVRDTLAFLQQDDPTLENTYVNVISKSGETAETAAQFIVFRDMLNNTLGDRAHEHIIAITDPSQGTMRQICDAEGYRTLPVPEGVGGRFSALSPVGLFSAAMCGTDIDALLDGAAAMDARCSNTALEDNPAALLAWMLMTMTERGKGNHVLMPYANRMLMFADWYRQLWAESLGKRVNTSGAVVETGATPLAALGATDQHSQVQLYREGPRDKVVGFVTVADFQASVAVPRTLAVESLQYLQGQTLEALLVAEQQATAFALCESGRPNFEIIMPRLNAHCVGQFMQLWQVATAYAGRLLDIDAYDQPAVETGKLATFGLMGREGFESWKTRVQAMS